MNEPQPIYILALVCAVLPLVGLASAVPWGIIWRSCQNYMSARRANTGMKERFIQALPSIIYGKSIGHLPGLWITTGCAICLGEFVEGEDIRVLPSCNHGFHMGCIDKWLRSHSSCPTCRHCLPNHGCKHMTNNIQRNQSNASEGQIHQPTAPEESREILDIESGIKQ